MNVRDIGITCINLVESIKANDIDMTSTLVEQINNFNMGHEYIDAYINFENLLEFWNNEALNYTINNLIKLKDKDILLWRSETSKLYDLDEISQDKNVENITNLINSVIDNDFLHSTDSDKLKFQKTSTIIRLAVFIQDFTLLHKIKQYLQGE